MNGTYKLLLVLCITAISLAADMCHAAPKKTEKKDDGIRCMMPGTVMAGRVWTPDLDGYFRLPGKLVGGKYGFIDKTGKTVIPPQFDEVTIFSDGMCAVRIKDNWGFIDRTGKLVIAAHFTEVSAFGEGLAGVRQKKGWSVIDKTGAIKIPETRYFNIDTFHEGLCSVKYGEKWGFIDRDGKEVLPCQYYMEGAPQFSDGMASVRLEHGKPANMIDKTGKILPRSVLQKYSAQVDKELDDMQLQQDLQKKYQQVYPFVDGIAMFKQADGKCGYIDKGGKIVIKPIYADANSHFEGLAGVYIGGHFEKGQVIGKMDPNFKYSNQNPVETLRKSFKKQGSMR